MQRHYVAETAESLVKGSWLVRAEDDQLEGKPADSPIRLALFMGPEAEQRAKDYAAGLERGRLRLLPGGRAVVPSTPVPPLELPAVH